MEHIILPLQYVLLYIYDISSNNAAGNVSVF